MSDNEQKANEFLKYIANNLPEIKYSLRKNINYEQELFEDAINEAIIKVHSTIIKNGTTITDFKQYFFIAAKFTYIYNQNKKRKKEQNEIMLDNPINSELDFEEEENDAANKYKDTLSKLEHIKRHIKDVFGTYKTRLYWEYMTAKASEWTSYEKYAKTIGVSEKELRDVVKEIRNYIINNNIKQMICQ